MACAAKCRFALRCRGPTNSSALARPASTRKRANAVTIAAPVGRSNTYEPARPAALAAIPTPHATVRTIGILSEKIEPMTAGTIRKLKTSSTPAVGTELATTMPKVRENTKSQTDTVSMLRSDGVWALETARSGPRAHQWETPIAAYSEASGAGFAG